MLSLHARKGTGLLSSVRQRVNVRSRPVVSSDCSRTVFPRSARVISFSVARLRPVCRAGESFQVKHVTQILQDKHAILLVPSYHPLPSLCG